MAISWDAGASLEKAIVKEHAPGQYAVSSTQRVWSGTLAGAIKQYLEKPDSQKPLYTILVEQEAGVGKTILGHRDINELAVLPDFPVS